MRAHALVRAPYHQWFIQQTSSLICAHTVCNITTQHIWYIAYMWIFRKVSSSPATRASHSYLCVTNVGWWGYYQRFDRDRLQLGQNYDTDISVQSVIKPSLYVKTVFPSNFVKFDFLWMMWISLKALRSTWQLSIYSILFGMCQ